jgi:hypothetical protein
MHLAPRLALTAALLAAACLFTLSAVADPASFTHQGRVIYNNAPYNETMDVRFDFFLKGETTPIITEEHSIDFSDGFYTVQLGEQASDFIQKFTANQPVELSVTIFPADNKDGLTLEPRQQITSVPYAVVSRSVQGGSVNATNISINGQPVIGAAGEWAGAPLSNNKLGDEAVSTPKLRNGAVTSDKLGDGSVTTAKLAPNSVNSGVIMDNGVSGADIQDNAVTSADIQNETIRQPDIQPGGGVYSYKRDIYTTRQTFSSVSGTVSTQTVGCADANDLPLSGTCTAPQDSGARLQTTEAFNWDDEALPAAWRCAFFNDSAPVQVEAAILCVRVPGP